MSLLAHFLGISLGARGIGLLARGVLLGLAAAVPIGPVNVEIARRVLRGGFRAGFALGCGAVSIDVTYATLSSLSFTRLLNRPAISQTVSIAGVALLIGLSFLCFRSAWRDRRIDPLTKDNDLATDKGGATTRSGNQVGTAYLMGLLMTLLNPMTLVFWFTVVPGQILPGQTGKLPIVCAGVFLGTIAWVITFTALLSWAGRSRWRQWVFLADLAGSAAMLAFAVMGILRLARPFL